MTKKEDLPLKGDYFYQIISLVVIIILSRLSLFWFILIAISAALFLWGAAVLLAQTLRSVTHVFSRRARAKHLNNLNFHNINVRDSRNQVFLPGKIRQSVDG